VRRLWNARRYGVRFRRRATFQLPETIRLRGQTRPLAAPQEQAARCDFVTCLLSDEYGLAGIRFPVRTIADLGANVGFFALAARAHFPGARLHCYEPNPRVHPYLEQNTAGLKVEVFREAVGAREGWVRVEDRGESNAATTAPASDGVAQVALGTVVARLGGEVDLAKIDCEGAEWDLFTEPAPWRHIRHVRMEYHLREGRTYAEVAAALERLGFRLEHHRPEGRMGTVFASRA
jgi:FkbM family methyltransferase